MRIHLPRSLLILVACLFSLWPLSCRDPHTTATPTPVAEPSVDGAPQDPADYGTLAKAVALTMQQPGMRQVVLAALGGSPYERGAMPLPEVLASHSEFAASVSAHLSAGGDGDRLRAAVVRPDADYVLVIPSIYDRVTWRGTDDVVVIGAPRASLSNVDSVMGYDVRGEPVHVRVWREMPFPIVLVTDGAADILQSARQFGSVHDPPRNDLGFAWSDCSSPDSSQDLDGDGIRDSCEFKLAHIFGPKMRVRGAPDDLRREEHWEVQEVEVWRCSDGRMLYHLYPFACGGTWIPEPARADTVVAAFYGFAYYRDLGDDIFGVTSHPGDAEFIVVYFDHSGSEWWVEYAFFSAHWAAAGESSFFGPGSRLEWETDQYSEKDKFITWVAEYKHANYISRDECNGGGWHGADDCSENDRVHRFAVIDTAKFALRIGTTYSRKEQPGNERFWSETYGFCGWQNVDRSECDGYYRKPLWFFGFRPVNWTGTPVDPVEITSFTGPTQVRPDDADCAWTVMTSGGSPPIWLRWSGILRGTAYTDGEPYDITGNVSTSGWLYVDAGGGQDQDSIEVSVSDDAPRCFGGRG